jgi:hypothetical protein
MDTVQLNHDRVRQNTPEEMNKTIDRQTEENIQHYASQDTGTVKARLQDLNEEWDVERYLELTSAMNVLVGLGLGLTVNKKWLLLSAFSAAFLVQHALQGWCPPLHLFRRFRVRTRDEINREKEGLRRQGQFAQVDTEPGIVEKHY